MSFSARSSDAAGVEKRKNCNTNPESGESLTGTDKGDTSKKERERIKPETHHHDVYIVKFLTPREGSDYHRALLVEYSRERDAMMGDFISRGELFEVVGPVHVAGKPICKYVFEPKQDQVPEKSENFIGPKVKLGRVAHNRLDDFFITCESVHPPRGPLNYDGPPDCNDWLNNVIVRLKQRSVVDFDPDYIVPTTEVSMVWMTGTK